MIARDTSRSSKAVAAAKATKVGGLALAGLARDPRPGRVDSVYCTVVNVIQDDGALVCLHPESVPLHPYSLVIGGAAWWAGRAPTFRGIRPGDRALLSTERVDFDESRLSVLLHGAEVWDSRLEPFGPGAAGRALKMLDAVWEVVLGEDDGQAASPFLGAMAQARTHVRATVGWGGGIGALVRAKAERLMGEVAGEIVDARCSDRASGSTTARQAGSPAERKSELAGRLRPLFGEFVGLGPGLTPSGDDFLLGLVAAARAFGPDCGDETGAEVAGEVADAAATVRQSHYMLKAASRGHFPEPVLEMVAELGQAALGGRRSGLSEATRNLLALGSTSGQDMLAGILFWLETLQQAAPEPVRLEVG